MSPSHGEFASKLTERNCRISSKMLNNVRADLARQMSCIVDADALAKQLENHPELRALLEHERGLREPAAGTAHRADH
jgi:hypothetical protein